MRAAGTLWTAIWMITVAASANLPRRNSGVGHQRPQAYGEITRPASKAPGYGGAPVAQRKRSQMPATVLPPYPDERASRKHTATVSPVHDERAFRAKAALPYPTQETNYGQYADTPAYGEPSQKWIDEKLYYSKQPNDGQVPYAAANGREETPPPAYASETSSGRDLTYPPTQSKATVGSDPPPPAYSSRLRQDSRGGTFVDLSSRSKKEKSYKDPDLNHRHRDGPTDLRAVANYNAASPNVKHSHRDGPTDLRAVANYNAATEMDLLSQQMDSTQIQEAYNRLYQQPVFINHQALPARPSSKAQNHRDSLRTEYGCFHWLDYIKLLGQAEDIPVSEVCGFTSGKFLPVKKFDLNKCYRPPTWCLEQIEPVPFNSHDPTHYGYTPHEPVVLGEGSFGKVFLAVEPEDKRRRRLKKSPKTADVHVDSRYAVKRVRRQKLFAEEVFLAMSMKSDYVMRVLGVYARGDYFYLMMRYAEYGDGLRLGRDLHSHLPFRHPAHVGPYEDAASIAADAADRRRRSPPTIASIAADAADRELVVQQFTLDALHGLMEVHSYGRLQHDIKAENFLVPENHVMLSDFGLAQKQARDGQEKHLRGTSSNLPPETLQNYVYTNSSELWSLCTVIYRFMFNVEPFYAKRTSADTKANVDNYFKGRYQLPVDLNDRRVMSKDGRDFLRKCFQLPERRFTDEYEMYGHKWLDNLRHTAEPDLAPWTELVGTSTTQLRAKLDRIRSAGQAGLDAWNRRA